MSEGTRWWENYLVRYLMPSIAGMFFVAWLYENSPVLHTVGVDNFISSATTKFNWAYLILWILLGSLYCYIVSYPILVFHATRVLDFRDRAGSAASMWGNPYLLTILFTVISVALVSSDNILGAFIFVVLFSAFQCWRIWRSTAQALFGFNEGYESGFMYAFLNKLAKRRSIKSKDKIENEDEVGSSSERTIENFEADLSDSYKHLREHGNTAFIFILEVGLLPLCYALLNTHFTGISTAEMIAAFLVVWCSPAMLVHWLGQHLERRFSKFNHPAP